jgi:hypothetical protein
MHRFLPFLALLLPQARAELKPKFQKFDRVALTAKIQTEVKSSNGRDSKYVLEIDLNAEVEKAEGDLAVFDCGVAALSIKGTLDGKPVAYDWKKGGADRGDKVPAIQKGLEKGWKLTLDGRKGPAVADTAGELCDTIPIFNPALFLGLSVPLPYDAVAQGRGWELKGVSVPYYGGFSVRYLATLDLVQGDTAKISSRLLFGKAETEIPIEGVVNVKGDGDASLEVDLRTGRPVRGATALRFSSAMGGLKREATQVIEFEVRR